MTENGNGQPEQLAVARPALMIQAATANHQLTLSVPEATQLRDQLTLALEGIQPPPPPKGKGKAPASARAKRPRGQAPAKK